MHEEDRVRLEIVSRSLLWWLCFNVDGRKNISSHRSSNDLRAGGEIQRRDGERMFGNYSQFFAS